MFSAQRYSIMFSGTQLCPAVLSYVQCSAVLNYVQRYSVMFSAQKMSKYNSPRPVSLDRAIKRNLQRRKKEIETVRISFFVNVSFFVDTLQDNELKLKDVSYDSDGMGITSHELRMRKCISNVVMICDRRQIHRG